MNEPIQDFTSRQYMVKPDFEIFHYQDKPTLEVEYHNHEFYELLFLFEGEVDYIIEGKHYTLKPDNVLIISNHELHRPARINGLIYERTIIWINPDFIRQHSTDKTNLASCFEYKSVGRHNLLRLSTEHAGQITDMLRKLHSCAASARFGSDIRQTICLLDLIIAINRYYLEDSAERPDQDVISDEKINQVIRHINDNLGESLTLDALSERFFISKYHLERKFKKYAGFTLHDYILRKRLIYARTLLAGGMTLMEISQVCGFNDYSSFIRAFKKVYHMTPQIYRKQLRPSTFE